MKMEKKFWGVDTERNRIQILRLVVSLFQACSSMRFINVYGRLGKASQGPCSQQSDFDTTNLSSLICQGWHLFFPFFGLRFDKLGISSVERRGTTDGVRQ